MFHLRTPGKIGCISNCASSIKKVIIIIIIIITIMEDKKVNKKAFGLFVDVQNSKKCK